MKLAAKDKRRERVHVIVPNELVAAIDDFRYRARMPSLAAAVRELLRRGLMAEKKALA